MNNDIKEILETIIEEKLENLPCTDMLNSKQASELLDYITNLQNGFKSTTEELCEYATRIDKVIEYCNKFIECTPRLLEVKNILQGDDKE